MLKHGPGRTPKDMLSEMFNYKVLTHSIVLCLIFPRAAVTRRLQRLIVAKWRLFSPPKSVELAKEKKQWRNHVAALSRAGPQGCLPFTYPCSQLHLPPPRWLRTLAQHIVSYI